MEEMMTFSVTGPYGNNVAMELTADADLSKVLVAVAGMLVAYGYMPGSFRTAVPELQDWVRVQEKRT